MQIKIFNPFQCCQLTTCEYAPLLKELIAKRCHQVEALESSRTNSASATVEKELADQLDEIGRRIAHVLYTCELSGELESSTCCP